MQIIEPKRCAVYTRKSHEDGLEQEFNSLDAQRDAAVNYIASQKSNGWQLINESYDDGGFSGGNTNRPALQRLLQDVRSGKVDIVVVYKIDRLSRSLTDFATLQTEFEKYGVAFCSVTQDINTATSAGRMMLNILMTFAQYEREIIAERIKDKLSASKRKGKYVGGLLPLGYDADSEAMKIIINPAEVEAVKLIFTEYVRTGSLKQVQRLLEERNIRTKAWTSKKGIAHGGNPINLAVLRNMITNPIYIGKLRYQGKVYDAEHDGIISLELWQKAQETLKANKRSTPQRMSNSVKPFAGLVYCGNCNAPMFLSKAVKKNGREYVYYVCQKDDRRANATCPVHRVPAEHLEKVLLAQVGRLFRTPAVLARICNEDFAGVLTAPQTEQALNSIHSVWNQMFPLEQHKLIHTLISKVVVFEDKIQIYFEAAGLAGLLKEAGADFEIADGNQMLECVITVPCLLRRSSGKLEIQVESEDVPEQPMTPLKTAILQAHQGMAQLTSGKASTMREIANKLKMDRSYLARTLQLANLAPDIVKLIWENRQPETLTLDKLRRGIPESWEAQRKLFLS